jgi:hypothetical protein
MLRVRRLLVEASHRHATGQPRCSLCTGRSPPCRPAAARSPEPPRTADRTGEREDERFISQLFSSLSNPDQEASAERRENQVPPSLHHHSLRGGALPSSHESGTANTKGFLIEVARRNCPELPAPLHELRPRNQRTKARGSDSGRAGLRGAGPCRRQSRLRQERQLKDDSPSVCRVSRAGISMPPWHRSGHRHRGATMKARRAQLRQKVRRSPLHD